MAGDPFEEFVERGTELPLEPEGAEQPVIGSQSAAAAPQEQGAGIGEVVSVLLDIFSIGIPTVGQVLTKAIGSKI